MRGLTIILESDAPDRVAFAHEMALVQRALEGALTLFITGRATAELAKPPSMLSELFDSGARVIACQTALSTHGLSLATLDPLIEAGGLVSLMQGLGNDRLVVI